MCQVSRSARAAALPDSVTSCKAGCRVCVNLLAHSERLQAGARQSNRPTRSGTDGGGLKFSSSGECPGLADLFSRLMRRERNPQGSALNTR